MIPAAPANSAKPRNVICAWLRLVGLLFSNIARYFSYASSFMPPAMTNTKARIPCIIHNAKFIGPKPNPSYPEENFSAVHPKQNRPEDQHHGKTMKHGLEYGSCDPENTADVPVQRVTNEACHRPRHHVNRDRIHSHHHQRKRP